MDSSKFEFRNIRNLDMQTLDLESYRTSWSIVIAMSARMRDNVERWMIHEGSSFNEIKNPENSFQILVKQPFFNNNFKWNN